ncbi:uncharacterized protein LOC108743782 [Agrilus planipennis]|uniref:Uncharacterized protein LOC108743782 n=1 Tax=Agrilus planipennis TaxID=224129 RepID=A0A1W4XFU8_AGRPL|nr:uncharacterized protein LOC108743782 [Agrilus planipennis]
MVSGKNDLYRIGAEASKLNFTGFWDWFVHVEDLSFHWKTQPTYVLSQTTFIVGGIFTFIHALKHGGRLPYLWFGIILHGLIVEALSYFLPDVDNFWHSQTPIILLGRRLPLHILLLYPVFLYNASIAVAKMRLPKWSEPFAVGLGVVLIDIPYDIVSVHFLHWTWHDTDPNIADRHYWVPWNSYYFHATFAASFIFWFHFTRKLICKTKEKWQPDTFPREFACTILTGLLGVPGGVLMFLPIYHPLHDNYRVHSEVTFFILFAIFLLLIWLGMRNTNQKEFQKQVELDWSTGLLLVHLLIHYSLFLAMTIFFKPEDEVAIGLKEPIGSCDEYVDVYTTFGQV